MQERSDVKAILEVIPFLNSLNLHCSDDLKTLEQYIDQLDLNSSDDIEKCALIEDLLESILSEGDNRIAECYAKIEAKKKDVNPDRLSELSSNKITSFIKKNDLAKDVKDNLFFKIKNFFLNALEHEPFNAINPGSDFFIKYSERHEKIYNTIIKFEPGLQKILHWCVDAFTDTDLVIAFCGDKKHVDLYKSMMESSRAVLLKFLSDIQTMERLVPVNMESTIGYKYSRSISTCCALIRQLHLTALVVCNKQLAGHTLERQDYTYTKIDIVKPGHSPKDYVTIPTERLINALITNRIYLDLALIDDTFSFDGMIKQLKKINNNETLLFKNDQFTQNKLINLIRDLIELGPDAVSYSMLNLTKDQFRKNNRYQVNILRYFHILASAMVDYLSAEFKHAYTSEELDLVNKFRCILSKIILNNNKDEFLERFASNVYANRSFYKKIIENIDNVFCKLVDGSKLNNGHSIAKLVDVMNKLDEQIELMYCRLNLVSTNLLDWLKDYPGVSLQASRNELCINVSNKAILKQAQIIALIRNCLETKSIGFETPNETSITISQFRKITSSDKFSFSDEFRISYQKCLSQHKKEQQQAKSIAKEEPKSAQQSISNESAEVFFNEVTIKETKNKGIKNSGTKKPTKELKTKEILHKIELKNLAKKQKEEQIKQKSKSQEENKPSKKQQVTKDKKLKDKKSLTAKRVATQTSVITQLNEKLSTANPVSIQKGVVTQLNENSPTVKPISTQPDVITHRMSPNAAPFTPQLKEKLCTTKPSPQYYNLWTSRLIVEKEVLESMKLVNEQSNSMQSKSPFTNKPTRG